MGLLAKKGLLELLLPKYKRLIQSTKKPAEYDPPIALI
jgi:hypothetical protein